MVMIEKWNNIPNSILINLVNSMEHRCKLIIENNGNYIPYKTISINQHLSGFQMKFKSHYLD